MQTIVIVAIFGGVACGAFAIVVHCIFQIVNFHKVRPYLMIVASSHDAKKSKPLAEINAQSIQSMYARVACKGM